MKTYIKFGKVSYVVNKEKRAVACIMQVMICNRAFKFIGVSKCSPDDVFDETKGKRIAESRAKVKVYKKAANLYKEGRKLLLKRFTYCANLEQFCNALSEKESCHVSKLCEG